LTFLVLLLLAGAVPSGSALRWMTASATEQTSAPVVEPRAGVDRQSVGLPEVDEGQRQAARVSPPACRAADALLPEPRAPDAGRSA
jgi:hypothetical protein